MKLKIWTLAMMMVFTAMARGATNDLTGLLQKGLFEEEANRDLSAAIANYQSLASAFDQDRQLAATAIFRLGECYRKLGKTNEAVIEYQRIIKEFSDQQTVTTLSRQNLAGLNAASNPAADNAFDSSVTAAEEDVELLKAQLNDVNGMSRDQKRVYVLQNFSNPVLTSLLQQLDFAQQKLIALKLDYTPDHPKMKTAQELVDDLNSKIDAQVAGVSHGLEEKLAAAQIKLRLQRQRQNELAKPASDRGSISSQETATTDDEEKQIRNIQAMIQNSPDLINAPTAVENGYRTPLTLAAEKGQLVVAKYLLDHGADVNAGIARAGVGTPLYLAADNGHKAMVELLLARGADVNSPHSPNPLYTAVSKGFIEVVEVLLANKADVNAPGILQAAVSGGRTNLIQLLIDHGADVNAADGNGDSPLHIAAGANKPDVARILIAAKADVNTRNKEGNTPLHEAAGVGSAEIVSLLLDSGANVDATNQVNITPLSFAVVYRRLDAARMLLEHKADPNHSGPTPSGPWPTHSYYSASQPLIYMACGGDRNEILKLLLDAGANPEADTTSGSSPLYAAINNNNVDTVELLLQHGANPNDAARATESPLNAALNGNKDTRIVQLLLDKGADPNARSHDGLVPLMRTSDPEVARWLIEHKADVNARIANSATPLMLATHRADEFLKILLSNGAQPDLQDTNGNTALHYAVHTSDTNSVAVLLENKANPNIQNDGGFTPLDLAKAGLNGAFPWSMWNPSGAGYQAVSPEAEKQIAAMLVKAGGLANLPKRDRIAIRRGASTDFSIFSKGPRDWNRFSLLELVATDYGLISTVQSGDWSPRYNWADLALRFPNFKKVVIYRRGSDPVKQTTTEVNVEKILADGDCSRDVWLDWGDVVEIPEADHPVDEGWPGLSDSMVNALTNCVSRQVTVKIKGESTILKLAPEGRVKTPAGLAILMNARTRSSRPSFMLRSVLDNSKLIRVSSDLSRVQVTRHDPVTNKTVEWVVDCTSPDQANLWLRDGDVIEVPEK